MFFRFFILWAILQNVRSTKVKLSSRTGTIEGRTLTASYSPLGNQTGIVFFGVPYVEPPVGNLRFRKPRPPKPWDGVLEAKEYKAACMSDQKKTYKNGVGGPVSEDCLYANVFTNQYCLEHKNCSVMLTIHGGRFVIESASAYDPEIIINNFVGQGRNIVVVTFNYRLGLFGLGMLNGDNQDTNFGLYDILEVVRWTRKEIKNFGGDKDRITMQGHSAGAVFTAAFSTSPLSKGLIHQQIIMSASMSNLSKKSNVKELTVVARIVGCLPDEHGFPKLSNVEVEKAYTCLRSKSAQQILDAQLYMLRNTTYYIGQGHIDGIYQVDYPDNLYATNSIYPINTMIGTTTAELMDSRYIVDPKNTGKKEILLQNLCEHIGYELYKEPEEFSQKCRNFYKNGEDAKSLGDDMEFYYGAIQLANVHSSKDTNVFVYSFDYKEAGNAYKKYDKSLSPKHGEDFAYAFGTNRGNFSTKDYVIEYIYSGMFADFVNFGDPSPLEDQEWAQYTPEKREYFLIDFDKNFTMPGMKDHYYPKALEFWSTCGSKSFKEHFSPSVDIFIIGNLLNPIMSHLNHNETGPDKTFEQFDKLYNEREEFLKLLKAVRKLEIQKKMWRGRSSKDLMLKELVDLEKINEEEQETGANFLLIIFGGTLLGGILYVSISHFCLHHRSRDGYQLLK
ncbi:Carboxylesterase type B domain-containing protein [Caenorhabditis elegans]|uniref:Carboxylesterase type B domain-containing protein n=1 Tax=Caenorhabditis elegans TaxID=6239 RepID=H9G2Y9_CAEEL|nr:Carboxylesterase type B domain-containing protein [Caenorhabditis elegans]CCG28268.1 Carboxylesterase type B domain-containing protein [Caenorhabditis elegans]|eukprot:NP_001256567.1 Uncharacterized protein CELE_ZC376.2 [Caenorhabditis elegans]